MLNAGAAQGELRADIDPADVMFERHAGPRRAVLNAGVAALDWLLQRAN
jgi:hypothetical protein